MGLLAHDVTNLVLISEPMKRHLFIDYIIYRLYNKVFFCINLYLKSRIHLTDIFCLLIAQKILYGSVKHQFIVTNIILIVQIRQK